MSGEIQQQPVEATDLISYLYTEYVRAVCSTEPVEHRKELTGGATQFMEFARAYLQDHRPRGSFVLANNLGVLLSNGVRLSVSPGAVEGLEGTMAPVAGFDVVIDPEAPITPSTYMSQGSVPISGFARKPKVAVDYADKNYGAGQAYVDKSKPTVEKRYDRKAPMADDTLNP